MFDKIKKYFKKIEISKGWGLGIGYLRFEENDSFFIHPFIWKIYIPLPWGGNPKGDMMNSWGIRTLFDEGCIYLTWNNDCKFIYFPWSYEFAKRRVFNYDMEIVDKKQFDAISWEEQGAFLEAPRLRFLYMTKDGELQTTIATIWVEEIEHHMRMFYKFPSWFPKPKKVFRLLQYKFDDEMGDRVGSWKGGVIGGSFPMEDGEDMFDAFFRFQERGNF